MTRKSRIYPTHAETSQPSGIQAWLKANHPEAFKEDEMIDKHTPGAWEYSMQGDGSIVIWTEKGQYVAKIPKPSGLYTAEEAKANAVLIAGAPTMKDMLMLWLGADDSEAIAERYHGGPNKYICKQCHVVIEHETNPPSHSMFCANPECERFKARALLTKLEGRQ